MAISVYVDYIMLYYCMNDCTITITIIVMMFLLVLWILLFCNKW